MPQLAHAETAREAIEQSDTPSGWEEFLAKDKPEPAADESGQWIIVEYTHQTRDMVVSVFLLNDTDIQPYYDVDDPHWGNVFELSQLDDMLDEIANL